MFRPALLMMGLALLSSPGRAAEPDATASETAPDTGAKVDGGAAAAAEPTAPAGFVRMTVAGVMPSRAANAVVLRDAAQEVWLPIWIGDAEAFSIQMRLDRRRFQRPLTHDLLDRVMRELDGRLRKVQVDDLKGNTFVGTIFIARGERTIAVDARPSDAIALAVGNRVPIFVARKVIERAGVRKGEQPESPDVPDALAPDGEEHTL
jgi:hypothetical protein